jgi:hypothetical protein
MPAIVVRTFSRLIALWVAMAAVSREARAASRSKAKLSFSCA